MSKLEDPKDEIDQQCHSEQMPALRPASILRAAANIWKDVNWSSTLNLPKSAFPARASAAELQKYRQRCADDLYAWQRANRPSDWDFVLHDGPPYANGAVHVGHALNKVLKDLILRWELSRGRRIHYRPGWDCHGLPIELKALQLAQSSRHEAKTLQDAPKKEGQVATGVGMTPVEIRRRARELATETVEAQKKSFREWGVMGEWDAPYKTMDLSFEVKQLAVFREMVKKGLVSRRHRPVYWSPSSRTALAEAELEYDDNHKCTAAFIKMPFVRLPKVLQELKGVNDGNISALIWTTTPWTMPANKAIAVHVDIDYALLELSSFETRVGQEEQMLVAKDRIEHVLAHLPDSVTARVVAEDIKGSQLADGNAACFNLFQGAESPILSADFVTATSGTGLVHMAPGHGMEDYQVCEKAGVGPAFAPVNDEGRFTADVFPSHPEAGKKLSGLDVQSHGVSAVLELLQQPAEYLPTGVHINCGSLVYATHNFTHKYPIDWRTKQPVIVRATAQWFADVSALQERAQDALDGVHYVPESGRVRLSSFMAGRSQWCISRQRSWGVPIPAVYHVDTGEACITDESISHIISVLEQRGTDAWFSDADDEPAWLHHGLESGKWVRGKDTMDVWFDSGTTWTALEPRVGLDAVSDVYVEGTDQHRGWFQSSLLTHVAVQEPNPSRPLKAPYDTLITHGFTLDSEGRKMSKSLGNVIAPDQIINGSLLSPVKAKKQKGKQQASSAEAEKPKYDSMGPDVLRLWVASSDYTRDVTIAVPSLQDVQSTLQKYRVTFKWLIGVLSDYVPPASTPAVTRDLNFADEAVLQRLTEVSRAVHDDYEKYEFHKAMKEISTFVNSNLSAFYFEICKDRLYTGFSAERCRTQGVLAVVLEELMKMLGPAVPHLVEEVWEHMPPALKNGREHPIKQIWAPYVSEWEKEYTPPGSSLGHAFHSFQQLSVAVKQAQEEARRAGKLKSGLACKVRLRVPGNARATWLQDILDLHEMDNLADLLVVSQVEVVYDKNQDEDAKWIGGGGEDYAWRYRAVVWPDWKDGQVFAEVVPPDGEKCVRCWKYTAKGEGEPCKRCQDVLKEKQLAVA